MSISASRLRRFSFGPVSSTNTTRLSKKPVLAGDARKHRVGDQMRDAPRIAGLGGILLARDLLAGRDVPQAGTAPQMWPPSARATRAGEHELRVDRLPGVDVRAARRDWRSFSGKLVGLSGLRKTEWAKSLATHRADLGLRAVARERRHGDRHRREVRAGMDVDVARRAQAPAPARAARRSPARGNRGGRWGRTRSSTGLSQMDEEAPSQGRAGSK